MNAVGLVVAIVLAGIITRGLLNLALTPARFRALRIVKWTLIGVLCFIASTQMFGLFLFVGVFALWWATNEPKPEPIPVVDLDEIDAEYAALLEAERHGDV